MNGSTEMKTLNIKPAAILLAICTIVTTPSVSHAAGADELVALLENEWDKPGKDIEADLSPSAKAHPKARIALGILHLKGRRFSEALAHLEAASDLDRGDLTAWRAKIWLLVYMRKEPEALTEMTALVNLYPAKGPNETLDKDLQLTARWMGRFISYMEGPRKEAGVTAAGDELAKSLQNEFLVQYEAGRKEVASLYAKYLEDLATVQAEEQANMAETAAAHDEKVAAERQRIESTRADIEERLGKLRDGSEAEIAKLNEKIEPLQRRIREAQIRAQPIQFRIEDIRREAVQIALRGNQQESQIGSSIYTQRVRELQLEIERQQLMMRPLEIEAATAQAELNKITAEQNGIANQVRRQLASAAAQQTALDRDLQKLERSEEYRNRAIKGSGPKYRGLLAKVESLTSYQTFPLDNERIKLLETLR